jgi:hypothetical protein
MDDTPPLVGAAERICEALRRHAELCSRDPEDAPAVMPALVEVREAMRAYSGLLFDTTGWGPPFLQVEEGAPFETDEDDEADEAADSDRADNGAGGSGEVPWVMVADKYILRVDRAGEFMDFARSRLGQEPASVEEAVRLLCEADGWRPAGPDGYPPGMFEVTEHTVDTCET